MPLALLAAFAGSLAIHVALLLGGDFELFAEQAERPALRAELRVPPPPVPAPAVAPQPPSTPPAALPAARPPRIVRAVTATPVPAPVEPPAPVAEPETPMQNDPVPPSTAAIHETPAAQPILPASGTIRFAILKESLDLQVGRAEHRWEFPGDGTYRLSGVTETSGLVAVFKPVRIETVSEGLLAAGGLRPERFRTLKNGRESNENADFDWAAGEVRLARDDSVHQIAPGTQDILSLNYQLAFLGRLEEGSGMGVVTGRKYARHAIDSLGEEEVVVPAGRFRTLHLRALTDSVTEVWIALDRHRLPVKIRFTDKKGESFVQVATEIGTE
jgi:hypothetical protein